MPRNNQLIFPLKMPYRGFNPPFKYYIEHEYGSGVFLLSDVYFTTEKNFKLLIRIKRNKLTRAIRNHRIGYGWKGNNKKVFAGFVSLPWSVCPEKCNKVRNYILENNVPVVSEVYNDIQIIAFKHMKDLAVFRLFFDVKEAPEE